MNKLHLEPIRVPRRAGLSRYAHKAAGLASLHGLKLDSKSDKDLRNTEHAAKKPQIGTKAKTERRRIAETPQVVEIPDDSVIFAPPEDSSDEASVIDLETARVVQGLSDASECSLRRKRKAPESVEAKLRVKRGAKRRAVDAEKENAKDGKVENDRFLASAQAIHKRPPTTYGGRKTFTNIHSSGSTATQGQKNRGKNSSYEKDSSGFKIPTWDNEDTLAELKQPQAPPIESSDESSFVIPVFDLGTTTTGKKSQTSSTTRKSTRSEASFKLPSIDDTPGSKRSTRINKATYAEHSLKLPIGLQNLTHVFTTDDGTSNIRDFIIPSSMTSFPTQDRTTPSAATTAPSSLSQADEIAPSKPPFSLPVDEASSEPVCPMCNAQVSQEVIHAFYSQHTRSRNSRLTVKQQTEFCLSHQDFTARTTWTESGYPVIDWTKLHERLAQHRGWLEDCLFDRRRSIYREKLAKELNSGDGNRALTLRDRFLRNEDGDSAAEMGYYGSRGARIMSDFIVETFSQPLRELATTDPLIAGAGGVSGFVQAVLIPEAALALCMEDMGVGDEKARERLAEGKEFGILLCEEVDDDIVVEGDSEDEGRVDYGK